MYNKNEFPTTPEKGHEKCNEAMRRMSEGLFADLNAGRKEEIEARMKAAAEILG